MKQRFMDLIWSVTTSADDSRTFEDVISEELVANGAVLPQAKIGGTVYILGGGRVREEEVKKICIHSNGLSYAFNWRGMGYEWVSDTDFGKTVFLTREEAERALKGADDGKAD